MKSTKAPIDTIDIYLLRVKEKLRGVPGAQVSEILAELRSHILDSVGTPNLAASPNTVEDIIERLGPPEALAEMWTENLMTQAETSRSPWLVMRTLFRLAIKSPRAFGACLVSVIGYLAAIAFFVCAVAKPFYPERDGLWWDARSHTLVGVGFIWPGPPDRELLGWWIIPLGLLIFVLLFFSTTRFARWNIGRIKLSFAKSPADFRIAKIRRAS
jgi:hypothetical protein